MCTNKKKLNLKMWLQAALAACFGIQSQAQRQAQFKASSVWPFLAVGIGLIASMVLTLILLAHCLTH